MQTKQYPYYLKATVILFGIVLVVYSMSVLRGIMVPFAIAMIIAILLNPLVTKFRQSGLPNVLAILLSMLIALSIFGGIMYFLSSQIAGFADSFPALKSKFSLILNDLKNWVLATFGISIEKQVALLNDAA